MVAAIAGLSSRAAGWLRGNHAANRPGGIGKDSAGDVIQTRDVEYRRHHANVCDSHVGLDIAGGEGGNHQFWEAIGSARMAAVAMVVPAEPPSETTP